MPLFVTSTAPASMFNRSPDQSPKMGLIKDANSSTRSTCSALCWEIRSTPDKGLGVFATEEIPKGSRIIAEPALLKIEPNEDIRYSWEAYKRLAPAQQARYDTLHYHIAAHTLEEMAQSKTLAGEPFAVRDSYGELLPHVRVIGIFSCNAFDISQRMGIFPISSRINHSCVPNAAWAYNGTLDCLTIHVIRDVKPGEEICHSYIRDYYRHSREQRDAELSRYGFRCHCPACRSDEEGDLRERRRARIKEAHQHVLYHGAGEQSKRGMSPGGANSQRLGLDRAEELIRLLIEEGVGTMELSLAYVSDQPICVSPLVLLIVVKVQGRCSHQCIVRIVAEDTAIYGERVGG